MGQNFDINSLWDGRARRIVKPNQVFCRIHVEDAGAYSTWSMPLAVLPHVNVVDHCPAPSHALLDFKAAAGETGHRRLCDHQRRHDAFF